ncbi:MAG: alkaline phosphatase family protein [Candidatus Woesearchaeota archaeon]
MILIVFFGIILSVFLSGCAQKLAENSEFTENQKSAESIYPQRLDWFIPDGMRADPDTFTIYVWAQEGKLPNIKRMMDQGSYGYAIPVYPSHTPVNFAALLTGTYPKTNGVADGPMRIEGQTLAKPAVAGFSSSARKVPAIWTTLENSGKSVVLLSIPGSTPPELKRNGITIRGRWGGWGADFHPIIFEKKSVDQRKKLARNAKLFFLGLELTKFVDPSNTSWTITENGDNTITGIYRDKGITIDMPLYGATIYAKMIDTIDNEKDGYDTVLFSLDKKNIVAALRQGEWSEWYPITFTWNNKTVPSHVKFTVIKIDDDGFYRIRVLVDTLNQYIVEPQEAANQLEKETGPMVDFVDNFPPQLIYYPEDKQTFMQESKMSFEWHARAVDAIYKEFRPDVFIHDIYSPNQMLTSRWWLGYIDPESHRYNDVSDAEREQLWAETKDMYLDLDNIVGKMLDNADENMLIVLSSDHGAVPLDRSVKLNNLFAQKGWINYTIDPQTSEHIIDWTHSKVVFLKMDNIYINPNGLGPNWTRGSGPAYEQLRKQVIKTLEDLRDSDGTKPLAAAVKWEDVKEFMDLPPDRSGDLVIANIAGYGWDEEISPDGRIFDSPLESGYKQAIFANNTKGLWTPFIIMGKGIKKGHAITEPISVVDQTPTILYAMNQTIPSYIEGKVINEVFE